MLAFVEARTAYSAWAGRPRLKLLFFADKNIFFLPLSPASWPWTWHWVVLQTLRRGELPCASGPIRGQHLAAWPIRAQQTLQCDSCILQALHCRRVCTLQSAQQKLSLVHGSLSQFSLFRMLRCWLLSVGGDSISGIEMVCLLLLLTYPTAEATMLSYYKSSLYINYLETILQGIVSLLGWVL